MRACLVALLVLVLCTGCRSGLRAWLLGQKPPYAGKHDPGYRLSTLDGGTGSLAAYRGRIVVLNLWATWCPPCRDEIPALERYAAQAAPRGITVVGVDQGEPAAAVATFVREAGFATPSCSIRTSATGTTTT